MSGAITTRITTDQLQAMSNDLAQMSAVAETLADLSERLEKPDLTRKDAEMLLAEIEALSKRADAVYAAIDGRKR